MMTTLRSLRSTLAQPMTMVVLLLVLSAICFYNGLHYAR